jgi:hypothetical protein
MLGEDAPHVAGSAVAVVGQRFDDHRNAVWAVTLVTDLLIGLAAILTRAAFDGAIDRVLGHVGVARGDHSGAQARVCIDVGQATARGRHYFANELGEKLAPLGVLLAFAVHDVFELGMAGHVVSKTRLWNPAVAAISCRCRPQPLPLWEQAGNIYQIWC